MKNKYLRTFGMSLAFFLLLGSTLLGCPAPKGVSLSLHTGINNQIVNLKITGEQFHKSVFVKLVKTGQADIRGANLKLISKTELTCDLDLKGQATGAWDVVVANIGTFTKKEKPFLLPKAFTIEYPAPEVSKIEPGQILNNKTGIFTITGANFRSGARVMLSNNKMDIGANRVNVLSENQLTSEFNLSGATPGLYSVKVINDDDKSGVLSNVLAIDCPTPTPTPTPTPSPTPTPTPTPTPSPTPSPTPTPTPSPTPTPVPGPVLNKITPDRGFNNGSIFVTIDGANFSNPVTAKLTGNGQPEISGLNYQIESNSRFTCFFDITDKPVGRYDVVVTNDDGQTATLKNGFTVDVFRPAINPNKLLKPIYFDYDKYSLRKDQIPVLDFNLKILKDNPELFILLGGHTDERGTREYNLELSSKRANTIKNYLVSKGIAPERITVYSYGKDYLLKTGHSEEDQKYNRRVDVLMWEAPPTIEQGARNPNHYD